MDRLTSARRSAVVTAASFVLSGVLAACAPNGPSGAPTPSAAIATPSGTAETTAAPTTTATPGPTTTSPAGEVPELLSDVPGFAVVAMEPAAVNGFRAALAASIAGAAQPGDVIGAQAVGPDEEQVDMFAFTVVPDEGSTEDAAIDRLLDGIAGAVGSEWVIDNERSLFAIDHEDGRRSILAAWGTVPDSTVFLYLTGEDAASVDAVADALLLAG